MGMFASRWVEMSGPVAQAAAANRAATLSCRITVTILRGSRVCRSGERGGGRVRVEWDFGEAVPLLPHDDAAVHPAVDRTAVRERALCCEHNRVGANALRTAAQTGIGEGDVMGNGVEGPHPGDHPAALQVHDRGIECKVLNAHSRRQARRVVAAAAGRDADQPGTCAVTCQHGQREYGSPRERLSHYARYLRVRILFSTRRGGAPKSALVTRTWSGGRS